MKNMIYDIFIIGAGPGGLTAALYGARAGLSVIVADPGLPGGQMTLTHQIDNYPGFPDGIDGFSLGDLFHKQALKWGAAIARETVISIEPKEDLWQIKTDSQEYTARTVIAASGARPRALGIPGEERLKGMGVSYCGTCDGPLYRNRTIAVIGGGNTALQEADFLARFVEKIYLIHRRDTFRAQQVLVDSAMKNEKIIPVLNTTPVEILGDDLVNGILVDKEGNKEILDVEGVFIFAGYAPNTEYCAAYAETDQNGRLITDHHYQCKTNGLYAIGDIRSKEVFQIANAVGEGAEVAHFIQEYIKGMRPER